MPPPRLARNEELVAEAVELCRSAGRPPASVEDAAKILSGNRRRGTCNARGPVATAWLHGRVWSARARPWWPGTKWAWRMPRACWSAPAAATTGLGAGPSPGWGSG